MSDFVNTIDLLGDDVVARQLLDGSITEFRDNIVTKISAFALRYSTNLTTIDMPNLVNTLSPYDNRHFANNAKLHTVNVPKLIDCSNYMFESDKSLEKVVLPSVKYVGLGSFIYCSSLRIVDLHICSNINNNCFENSILECLILRNVTMCTLTNTDSFKATPIASGTGYIYVPRALVDSYKTATNWSTFANQFRALEDYTVDGTVTGELDESKI